MALGNDGNRLPAGWRWVKLGEVCRVASGSTPSSDTPEYWDGDIVWITPTDLGRQTSHLITDSSRRITQAGFENSGTEMVPAGSVVMSSRAPIGHLAIATVPLCTNQGCKCFVPGNDVDNHFLFFALKMSVPALQALGSGATFAEVSKSQVQAFSIPLPPIPEQKRIAAILTEQMTAVEKARTAAEARLKAAKELSAAYLREVFESEEAQGWQRKRLGKLAAVVQNGIYKSAEHYGHGQPFVRMYNIPNSYWKLNLDTLAQVSLDEAEKQKFLLQADDLLVSRVNSFELVGKCAWVGQEAEGYAFENMLIRVRLNDGAIPKFVAQQFGTSQVRQQIEKVAKRAIGQASINSEDLRGIELVLPPREEQWQLAKMLEEKSFASASLFSSIESELGSIKELPAALLRQAFSGQL